MLNTKSSSIVLFILVVFSTMLYASGHRIEVRIEGFSEKELYLAYYYGERQYVTDTVYVNGNGSFVFQGEEKLSPGLYLLVLPPNNSYFEILIDNNEQNFSVRTKIEDLTGSLEIYGDAPTNNAFYSYISFISSQRKIVEALTNEKKTAGEGRIKEIDKILKEVQQKVNKERNKAIRNNPGSLLASMFKADKTIDIPDFKGVDENEVQNKRFYYYRDHYFDYIDLKDERLVRTSILAKKINTYMESLSVQHPDSIIVSIDKILGMMNPQGEIFKYFLAYFINKYAKSNIVGMDAVYVHLGLNYYAKGMAPWIEKDELSKIVADATSMKPLLVGKTAPDFTLKGEYGADVSLHRFDAKYTVLFFWKVGCVHCAKSLPDLKKAYEKYADKGLKVFTVNTDPYPGNEESKKLVNENKLPTWTNISYSEENQKVINLYNISSTPQLYLLDQNKKILSKRISTAQIEKVMENILKLESN